MKRTIIKSEKEALKLENYFDNQRNEMFFSKGVVFVEGATEKFVFPYTGQKMGIDIDRYGVSIVECGGKGNLLTFAKVANSFGIPYVVVADDDIKECTDIADRTKREKITSENANHAKKNAALKEFVPKEQLFWMVPNIEAVMGINENTDNKIKQAMEHLQKASEQAGIEKEIQRPLRAILQLIGLDASEQNDICS